MTAEARLKDRAAHRADIGSPVKSMEQAREEDPTLMDIQELFEHLRKHFKGSDCTALKIAEVAMTEVPNGPSAGEPIKLQEAVGALHLGAHLREDTRRPRAKALHRPPATWLGRIVDNRTKYPGRS
jgi:hypothetical protein